MSTDRISNASDLYWMPGQEMPHQGEVPHVNQLIQYVNSRRKLGLQNYWDLHKWSVTSQSDFWGDMWDYLGIIGESGTERAYTPRSIEQAQEWFPDARLNFAENLLLGHANALSNNDALISTTEPLRSDASAPVVSRYTWSGLYHDVVQAADALRHLGVKPGDRVASYSASNSEIIVAFLAANAIGAIYCSCPSEFGPVSVIDRFSQFQPKIIFSIDSTRYNGKIIDTLSALQAIIQTLPSVTNVVIIGHAQADRNPKVMIENPPPNVRVHTWQNFMRMGKPRQDFQFWRGPFQHPIFVVFSSGTTGKPKCIVHGAGNILLPRKLIARIHLNLDHRDRCCQFTTTGWVMYNISMCFMTNGCTLLTYDGSPFKPVGVMWKLIEDHQLSYFGTSPRYLQAMEHQKYYPNEQNNVSTLKVIAVTGAPVTSENYDFVSRRVKHIYLFNASGGTEIASSFISSVPTLPIYKAEIQSPTIGVAAESVNEEAKYIRDVPGSLVVTKHFPNMPLGFLHDPDRKRYKAAYFEDFKTPLWSQQDYVKIRSLTGGYTILGRSDGILNPGGVRFGSSEIYTIVDKFPELFEESICVGQRIDRQDERVILFLKMKDDQPLTESVKGKLKQAIRQQLSVRHIPAVITKVSEIPVTNNGKKVETYVKKLINGHKLQNLDTSALSNPGCLQEYIDNADLRFDVPKAKI